MGEPVISAQWLKPTAATALQRANDPGAGLVRCRGRDNAVQDSTGGKSRPEHFCGIACFCEIARFVARDRPRRLF